MGVDSGKARCPDSWYHQTPGTPESSAASGSLAGGVGPLWNLKKNMSAWKIREVVDGSTLPRVFVTPAFLFP